MQNSTHLHKTLLAALICTCGISAGSNPLGPQVTHGQASMVTTGKLLSVTNTPGTVINWQGFSIAADETTRFIQQNAQSSVLNRIIGQDPSQILGTLQSNGKVFLINPNGIVFGAGARVDVNALVASSLNIGNDDFLTNKLNFSGSAAAGDVVNQGVISTAQGGRVYLISPNVTNSGIINSPGGNVMLAAGHSVRLVDPVDPNLQVVISAPGNQALNVGRVLAEGGNIGMYGALVRQQGLLSANSAVRGENGKIIFKASGDTLLEAGSVTSATGAGRGGEIQVLGERVALRGNAAVDVSGQQGGGTVLVGGDYHGDNTAVQNAKQTTMDRSASIRADAGQVGDGGKVIVWSDQITNARGAISARGGTQAGDGGFVEVSGKKTLDFHAKVDVGANHGHGGTLLLDPASISLIGGSGDGASEGANTFSGGSNPAGNVSFVDPDFAQGGVSNIYQSELEGLGPNTNIVLEATNYIGTTGTFLGNQLTLPNNSNLTRRTRNASTDSNGQEPPIGINLTTSLEVKTQGSGSITLPNLTACIATPTLPGCSVVLPNLTACIATPTLPGCNLTLPNTTACIATPTLPVCNVTLPNLTACIATPTLPGCQVTLPNLTACIATPTLPGCSVVLPNLTACIATPTLPVCNVSNLTACIATPTLPGCQVTLPNLTACIATPTLPGCQVTLPNLTACIATPTLPGCNVTLPNLTACIATPTLPGCQVVLPPTQTQTNQPIGQAISSTINIINTPSVVKPTAPPPLATNYIGTTGTFLGNQLTLPNNSNLTRRTRNASTDSNGQEPPIGINLTTSLEVKTQGSGSITLPNLTACIATPTLPGCSVVLPNLTACIATPTLPGCNLTLPNTTACIATPTLPVCNVTLPNLTACIATPTLPGCQVTLPNLTACIATPTLPGCQVVLPPTQTQTN